MRTHLFPDDGREVEREEVLRSHGEAKQFAHKLVASQTQRALRVGRRQRSRHPTDGQTTQTWKHMKSMRHMGNMTKQDKTEHTQCS